MPIVGKFFPSQKSQEKVFLLLRRHWFTYFGFVGVSFIMSIPVFVLIAYWINNPEIFAGNIGNIAIVSIFAYTLFSLGLMLYGFIDYYLDVYIVTNERIVNIEQNGFFRREISELNLHQVQDVSAKVNGFFPTMMHYGNIFIQTAGERENFVFKSIPNPYRVSKLIVDLHEAQLEERDTGTESGETMEPMSDERSENVISSSNLAEINPKYFSLARKRTKNFLKGETLEETELSEQYGEELADIRAEKLLENIDKQKTGKETKIATNSKKASKDKTENRNTDHINDEEKAEGELHENEVAKIKD